MSLEHMAGEQQEGGSPQSPGGVAVAEEPSDQPKVVIAPDEGTESKGPGFWRRITGRETKPLVLVPPPHVTEILNPGEQSENTQSPPIPPNQTQAGETQEIVDGTAAARMEREGSISPPDRGGGDGREGGGNGGNGPERPGGPEGENPEFKDPQYRARRIAERLQVMDRRLEEVGGMSDEERRLFIEEYDQLSRIFTNYYNKNKLFDKDAATAAIEQTKKSTDQNLIDSLNLPEEEQNALKELLRKLDQAETQLGECKRTLALKEKAEREGKEPPYFDKKGWRQQEAKRNQLQARVTAIEEEINNPDLLGRRREEQSRITKEVQELQKKIGETKQEELRQILGEPGDWEKKLIIKGRKIELREPPEDLSNFGEVLKFLNEQENLRKTGNPDFWQEGYNRAKEALSWYFQEAERKGILYDLKKDLDFEFQQHIRDLGLQPVTDAYGREQYMQRMTLNQVRDLIRARIGNSLIENRLNEGSGQYVESQNVESQNDWEDIAETGRFSLEQDRSRFQGIRAEYVRRAYQQMRAGLTNLVHLKDRLELQTRFIRDEMTYQEYMDELEKIPRDIPTDSIFGEWNFGFEARERREMEKRALEEQNKTLFEETEFGLIVLTGRTSWEIEKGAEQAAEYITSSAGTYSLEAIQQRREYLIRAIEKRRENLRAEAGTKEGGDALTNRIKRLALNKLDFYILEWLAQNLRMDEYSSYFNQTVMMDGIDRLKAIPTMGNGLVGLAVWFLLQPEYRLFFRPGGFRNQLNESGAQYYLRNFLKYQIIDKLLQFEINGESWQDKTKTLQNLINVQSTNQFLEQFTQWNKSDTVHHPAKRLEDAQQRYDVALKQAQESSTTPEALLALREAREMLAFEQSRYQRARETASAAVEEAVRVMDIFGESARYGAPSIITENGDHISIEHAKLIKKFAILQAAKKYGDTNKITVIEDDQQVEYRVEDTIGSIRRRSQEWIKRWTENGHFWDKDTGRLMSDDKIQPFRQFDVKLKNGQTITFTLASGFEETGLTKEEWQESLDYEGELRANGYNAKFKITKRDEDGEPIRDTEGVIQMEEVSFWDIIQMDELQPVLSNFVADYKSSTDQINDEELVEEAAQGAVGRLESIQTIRKRLGIPDGMRIEGRTAQEILKKYTSLITDSTYFDEELENLVYFEAVHGYQTQTQKVLLFGKDGKYHEQEIEVYPTSVARVDYGHQGLPWGKKRQQNPKAFWYTNEDRTIQRAEDAVWFMPVYSDSLSKESASRNILEMFWDLNRLEKDDNWTLMTSGMRVKDAWDFRTRAEGDIVNVGGEWQKIWGMLEKPGSNANFAWSFFPVGQIPKTPTEIRKQYGLMDNATREKFIEWLFNQFLGDRFAPMTKLQEKQNAIDRQALSSGLGYENNQKFAYRFITRFLYSAKEGDGRTEGGIQAYREIEAILYWMMDPGSYREKVERKVTKDINGRSEKIEEVLIEESAMVDELWRKLTPSHNPRIQYSVQEPRYVRLRKAA